MENSKALPDEVKDELLKWARSRFWIITVIVLVVGFFGIRFLIKESVRDQVDAEIQELQSEIIDRFQSQVLEAWKKTVLAEEAALKAKTAYEITAKEAGKYAKTVATLQEAADRLDAQFVSMRQRIEAESGIVKASTEKEIENVRLQLARLRELVEQVARGSTENLEAVVETYQETQSRIEKTAKAEKERFTENSVYLVTLFYSDKITFMLSRGAYQGLVEAGFKTSETSFDPYEHTLPSNLEGRNVIAYPPGARSKAHEIMEILASYPEIGEATLVERRAFPEVDIQQMANLAWSDIPKERQISVYILKE
jgi:uncharacterized membrane-anchored protein YhcB (DUF1043 family)